MCDAEANRFCVAAGAGTDLAERPTPTESACSQGHQGRICLILQLSFLSDLTQASSPVACFRYGLMNPTPERPCEEVVERDAGGELEAADETTDLACAEVDHRSRPRCPFLRGVAALSVIRMPARKASASMARVMCRYQPCQERTS